MAIALDLAGFIVAAVELSRRYDTDVLRIARYDQVLVELIAVTGEREGALTLGAIEEVFAKYALPTAHLTQILKGL